MSNYKLGITQNFLPSFSAMNLACAFCVRDIFSKCLRWLSIKTGKTWDWYLGPRLYSLEFLSLFQFENILLVTDVGFA